MKNWGKYSNLQEERTSNPGYELDTHGTAVFKLRDFLGPSGRYRNQYDDLPKWMEEARRNGLEVLLISVPEFPMVYGSPGPAKKPWTDASSGLRFRTARGAIRGDSRQ